MKLCLVSLSCCRFISFYSLHTCISADLWDFPGNGQHAKTVFDFANALIRIDFFYIILSCGFGYTIVNLLISTLNGVFFLPCNCYYVWLISWFCKDLSITLSHQYLLDKGIQQDLIEIDSPYYVFVWKQAFSSFLDWFSW